MYMLHLPDMLQQVGARGNCGGRGDLACRGRGRGRSRGASFPLREIPSNVLSNIRTIGETAATSVSNYVLSHNNERENVAVGNNIAGKSICATTPTFSLDVSQLATPNREEETVIDLLAKEDEIIEDSAAREDEIVHSLPLPGTLPCIGPPAAAVVKAGPALRKKRPHGKTTLKCGPLLEIDDEIQKLIAKGGDNNSEEKDGWARRRFDAWRDVKGFSIDIPIEALDLKQFAGMLETFILQVQRLDGTLFPPETLRSLFLCFNRIIRMERSRRSAQSSNPEMAFDIMTHPFFLQAVTNLEVAMQRSGKAGRVTQRKKSRILTAADEARILAHDAHQVNTPYGLQRRFGYYCMSRFLVRGGKELAKLRDVMFLFDEDAFGKHLAFSETISKNHHVDKNHFKTEDFRATVRCRETDVLSTWECLLSHLALYEVDDEFGGSYVFSQSVSRHISHVWYSTNHCSEGTMRKWLKQMATNAGLGGDYDNKSCRASSITWLQAAGVPEDVGMEITGHKSINAYQKDDQSGDVRIVAAMAVIASGGTLRYEDALIQVQNPAINPTSCVSDGPSVGGATNAIDNVKTVQNHVANCNSHVSAGPSVGIGNALQKTADRDNNLINETTWPDDAVLEKICVEAEKRSKIVYNNCSFTFNFN